MTDQEARELRKKVEQYEHIQSLLFLHSRMMDAINRNVAVFTISDFHERLLVPGIEDEVKPIFTAALRERIATLKSKLEAL